MNKIGIFFAYWVRDWASDVDVYIKSIERAAGLGFNAIELFAAPLYDMSKSDMDKLRDAQEKYDMKLIYSYCFTADNDVSAKDAVIRKRGIDFMKQVIKNIGYVSGPTAIGGITNSSWHGVIEDSKQAHWERAVESVKEIIKETEEKGITYLLETVNRFETYMLNTHQESLQFAKDVDHPNIKIHLDTFHMNIDEDDMETAIINTGNMIGHFHVGENNRRPPGTGNLDWDMVFASLKKVDYQGPIVMEPFVLSGGTVAGDIALYRELMPGADLDVEAKKALDFVRGKL